MSNDYKAIRFHEYGASDRLVLESIPRPTLKADEVLVEVHYAGVNPVDWKIRAGYLKDYMPLALPAIPGIDVAGVVVELGPAAKRFSLGQAVFGVSKGGYAEYAVASEKDLVAKPDKLGFDLAATVPVGALTAWKAIEDSGVGLGQTVVIQGGAGGVGLFAVQLARLKGAKVIGTASAGNLAFIASLGADKAVDYKSPSLAAELGGADVLVDLAGGEALEKAYGLVRKGGVLVTVAGQVSAEKAAQAGITALVSGRGPADLLVPIAKLLAEGKLRCEVAKVFPLAEAKAAQELCQSGHGRGRIVLKVR
jgi:NADPH:quinone reductase-like Zn-dependent oxidoreductase